MIVKKIEFSDVFAANCYFYISEVTGEGFIIDPSAHAQKLLEIISSNAWDIEKILLTHSHLDHLGAALEVAKALNIPIFGHQNARLYLSSPDLRAHFTDRSVLENMQFLNDGDEIALKKDAVGVLKVISTPGHTLDSVVYYDKKAGLAFTGDTVFRTSRGRTDIEGSGGDEHQLKESIIKKILALPDETVLYPGHGEATTIAEEKIWY